jgi:hypothetical protein
MKKILLTAFLILFLFSCKENKSGNNPLADNAVDHTESSISGSFKKSRNENMIDQIYYELIKDDNKLKALDDKINKSNQEANAVISKYDKILQNSEAYYRDALSQSGSITDSLMKQDITKLITNSSDRYNLKIQNVKNLITLVNTNEEKMNNLYIIFKIKKTLPEIEKYQNAHPLKPDSLNNFINKQNKLLNELKNLK